MNRVLSLLLALSAFPSFAWSAPAPVSSTDRALHKGMMVLDTHLDTPAQFSRPGWDIMDRHDRRLDQSQVDYPRMIEGGLDGGFWSIYTSQGPLTPQGYATARDAALVRAVEIREMVARHHDRFALAFRAADAAPILAGGRKVVFQSIENSYPLGEDLGLLSTFHRLGVRMVGPVHFSNNQFADSATDPNGKRWNGLSPLGQALVKEANRLGMILDGSHASDDVLDQLIDLSEAPVILSHSGVKAVYDHPRNIPDALLRKLADKGGVIQINAYSAYLIATPPNPQRMEALRALNTTYGPRDRLTAAQLAAYNRERVAIEDRFPVPRATFEDFMKHLLHALEVAGVDHVGVGADWDGGGGLIGFEDISALPQVTARLRQAGYGEAGLRKIWGGNVLRLLGEVEVVAERLRSGAAQ
jgi:membrane dipeptidase